MNVLIELNQVDARATREAALEALRHASVQGRDEGFYSDTDEPGENGSAEVVATPGQPLPAEVTRPVLVAPASIRSITPRRERPGARLTFADGGGYAVTETYEEIKSILASAGISIRNREGLQLLTDQSAAN